MSTGENIRRLREGAGLTQAELGKRVGVSQSMIAQIERGRKEPSLALCRELVEALECRIGDIIGESA